MASREMKAFKRLKGIRGDDLPYILESNPHSVFGDFLNGKEFAILIRTLPSTAPCPQGD
jgi:hypothetical protein